jgi:putative NIF3 family GTP cyclohydrolase 1 type 2
MACRLASSPRVMAENVRSSLNGEDAMPRSKKFSDLVQQQARTDKKFAEALLREGVDALLSGDVETGNLLLRDTIKARSASGSLRKQRARRPRA